MKPFIGLRLGFVTVFVPLKWALIGFVAALIIIYLCIAIAIVRQHLGLH